MLCKRSYLPAWLQQVGIGHRRRKMIEVGGGQESVHSTPSRGV